MMKRAFATTLLLLTAGMFGCGQTPEPLTDVEQEPPQTTDAVSTPADPQQASTTPQEVVDTGLRPDAAYPVPELPPEQLLELINQLAIREPQGENEEAFIADQISITKSRLVAADRIILSQGIDPGLTEAAVVAKLDALRTLAVIDAQGLGVHFETYVGAMVSGDNPKLGLLAEVSRFQFEIDRLGSGQVDQPDALLRQLDAVLQHPNAAYPEFLATQYAPVVLDSRGFPEKATSILRKVGEAFATSDNEQLAKEAKQLLAQTAFREKVIAAMDGGNAEIRSLFIAIRDLLKQKEKLDLAALDTTLNAAQMLEYNGKFDAARSVFNAVGKAFADHDDKAIAEQAERSIGYAHKRLDLIGKEINIEGVHIDGTPFTWSKTKGKVVLVDFWATWSGPWQSELPNVRAAYNKFHDEGFEVVSVNLDDDRNQVYDFLRATGIPWSVIVDETGGGFGNANAIRYGVEAVPFMALVGRDGRVADIHVRGAALADRVGKLINAKDSRSARRSDVEAKSSTR